MMKKKERMLRQAGALSSDDDFSRLVEAGVSYEQVISYFVRPNVAWFTAKDIINLVECEVPPDVARQYAAKRLRASEIIVLYRNGISPDDELLTDYYYSDVELDFSPYYVLRNIPSSWYREYVSPYKKYPGKRTFEKITNAFVQEQTPTFVQRELKKSCGLLTLGRYSPSLLEELARNLDQAYQSEKPVALSLLARDDWNGNYHLDTDIYQHIAKKYKLFIYEIASPRAAFKAITTCGTYHGRTASGEPLKPIELLLICGHGNKDSLTLADFPHEKTLNRDQRKQFRSVKPYVTGTVIINSCSTGEGGKEEENFATSVFSAMQPQRLYAPMESEIGLLAIDFHPIVPHFTCGMKRTLVLER